jgi:hypothetical protein
VSDETPVAPFRSVITRVKVGEPPPVLPDGVVWVVIGSMPGYTIVRSYIPDEHDHLGT